QGLTGDATFEQVTGTAGTVVRIGVSDVELTLGPLSATNGTGMFVLTPDGVAGSLSVEVEVDAGTAFSLTGALRLEVNTTDARVTETLSVGAGTVSIDVAAGPYLRLAGTGIVLTVLSQQLRADIAFERTTSYGANGVLGGGDDTTVTRIALANVAVSLAAGAAKLSLTGGSALFVLTATGGLAGRVAGTVALTGVPGVALAGTLVLEINTTTARVNETVQVGTATATVDLPAGLAGGYLRIAGTGVQITVGGQTLAGDVEVVKNGTDLTLTLSEGVIRFGTPTSPLVSVTEIEGVFRLTATGMAGSVSATLAVTVPGLAVDGDVAVQINSGTAPVVLNEGET
ncbi:MAG: hypothetical protein ACRCSL_06855, partial [Microbacterium sp.]